MAAGPGPASDPPAGAAKGRRAKAVAARQEEPGGKRPPLFPVVPAPRGLPRTWARACRGLRPAAPETEVR
ncbi:unnamed protein product [Caretta caretta]